MKLNRPVLALAGVAIAAAGFIATGSLLGGCASPPAAFFTPVTNSVGDPFITTRTNTVNVTNTVYKVVTETNTLTMADGSRLPQITITPVQHDEVVIKSVLEFQTNQLLKVDYVPNSNAKMIAGAAGGIFNMFAPGTGGLVGQGLLGLAGVVAVFFGRKYVTNGKDMQVVKDTAADTLQKTAGALTQGIESYREVVKSTPQGAAVDQSLMKAMQKDTRIAGVADIISDVVDSQVSNEDAKKLVAIVRQEVDRLAAVSAPTAPVAPKV